MYQHPGVFVEYLPSGLLAIEAASTSTAAFVGPVKRGDLNTPVFITSASDYATQFGPLDGGKGGVRDLGDAPDDFGLAVNAFFNNGGTKAYIVPVGGAGGQAAFGAVAVPGDGLNGFYFTANSPGAWANGLEVHLSQTDATDATLGYVLEVGINVDNKFKVLERYTDTRVDPTDGRYLALKVDGQSGLVGVERKAIADAAAGATSARASAPLGALDPTSIASGQTLSVSVQGASTAVVTFDGTAKSLQDLAAAIQARVRQGVAAASPRAGFLAQVTRDGRLLLVAGGPFTPPSGVSVGDGTARLALGFDPTALIGSPVADPIAGASGKSVKLNAGAVTRTVTFGAGVTTLAGAAAAIAAAFQGAPGAGDAGAAIANFSATAANSRLVLSVPQGAAAQAIGVTTAAGDASSLIGLGNADATFRPSILNYPAPFAGGAAVASFQLIGGVDSPAPGTSDYQAAFDALRDFRDASIILLPGQHWTAAVHDVIDAAVTHAEYMGNRMVIVDPPDPMVAGEIKTPKAVNDLGFTNSPFTALYYPWLTVANPFYDPDVAANKPQTFAQPPSAYAAGLWARIDNSRGVWKAPAGLEATVRGSQGPNVRIGNEYQDNLNEWGVNCIRPIQGPSVLWGARTLATKAKPDFRYIPVRRTESMIGESLYNALQAVVFEPNDHPLWASLRASATNFMDGLFRSGAFQGEKASDAYFVRCGLGQTMTQADVDGGIVRLVVGFAPLKPAEFVVVQIQQIVGVAA